MTYLSFCGEYREPDHPLPKEQFREKGKWIPDYFVDGIMLGVYAIPGVKDQVLARSFSGDADWENTAVVRWPLEPVGPAQVAGADCNPRARTLYPETIRKVEQVMTGEK